MKKSFGHALDGISWSFRNHKHFKIHSIVGIMVLLLGMILNISYVEYILLIFVIILVFIVEMVNTSVEEITNLVTLKWAHQAKIAKDVAAGMVLVTVAGAVLVGALIFVPYIYDLLV